MYTRITRFPIKAEKYDDLLAWNDEIRDELPKIPGFVKNQGYMVRSSETEVISITFYENRETAENAAEHAKEIMGQIAQFLIGPPEEPIIAEVVRHL